MRSKIQKPLWPVQGETHRINPKLLTYVIYASIFDILSPCFGITIYILLTDTVFRSSNVLLHLPYSLKFSSSHFATLSESLFPIIPVASFLRLSTAFSTA